MQGKENAIFWRHDTFLGVCEAIGQDFGFNPNWLRVAFSLGLLPSPAITLSIYLGLAVIVAASRYVFPAIRKVSPENAAIMQTRPADNDEEAADLAIAA